MPRIESDNFSPKEIEVYEQATQDLSDANSSEDRVGVFQGVVDTLKPTNEADLARFQRYVLARRAGDPELNGAHEAAYSAETTRTSLEETAKKFGDQALQVINNPQAEEAASKYTLDSRGIVHSSQESAQEAEAGYDSLTH